MFKVNVTAENLNGLLSNMLLLNTDLNQTQAQNNLSRLHGAQDWESLVNSTDVAQPDEIEVFTGTRFLIGSTDCQNWTAYTEGELYNQMVNSFAAEWFMEYLLDENEFSHYFFEEGRDELPENNLELFMFIKNLYQSVFYKMDKDNPSLATMTSDTIALMAREEGITENDFLQLVPSHHIIKFAYLPYFDDEETIVVSRSTL
jgi:hypothetical protein